MDFGKALDYLKQGKKITRKVENYTDILVLEYGELVVYEKDDNTRYVLEQEDCQLTPIEILAEDWELVE